MKTTQGVLFDLDGVLVLTEPLKAVAHGATVRRLGGSISSSFSQKLYKRLMGQSHEVVGSAFTEAGGVNVDLESYTNCFLHIYQELLRTKLETAPGAVELLQQLVDRGYLLAVVSSTHSKLMDRILDQSCLARFFDVRVSADDVDRRKPAPDAYLLALDLLACSPTYAVVIEDSETGVKAAVNAGIRVLALRHSFNTDHDFSRVYAIFDSLLEYQAIVQVIDSLLHRNRQS